MGCLEHWVLRTKDIVVQHMFDMTCADVIWLIHSFIHSFIYVHPKPMGAVLVTVHMHPTTNSKQVGTTTGKSPQKAVMPKPQTNMEGLQAAGAADRLPER